MGAIKRLIELLDRYIDMNASVASDDYYEYTNDDYIVYCNNNSNNKEDDLYE